ncbi:MAG: SMP-30/gluconolactonase/LRE family protein [Bacteroidota bacterium]|nr:SMP-30/gluconolactonase/LRE family protein [Bacteroidota bacterium]
MKIEVLHPSACQLGESPLWHDERMSCFWVDIEERSIYEYNWSQKKVERYQLKQRVSLIVQGNGNDLIVGLQGGIGRFDLATRKLSWVTDLGIDWINYRCNDGGCDNRGRLWIGTMDLNHKKEAGTLYCVDINKEVKKKIGNVSISNGLVWSLDNKHLYYTDSVTREILSYSYEEKTGEIFFEKVVVSIPEQMGFPDGMTIDTKGMLWVALWGGGGVGRFDVSSGKMIAFIEIPAPNVSSCSFVGKQLDSLLITTARQDMSKEDLLKYPQSGHVFIMKPGVKGVPVFHCGL